MGQAQQGGIARVTDDRVPRQSHGRLGKKAMLLPSRRRLPERANGIQAISHDADAAGGSGAKDLARGQISRDDIGMSKGLGQGGEGVHAPTLDGRAVAPEPQRFACGQSETARDPCG